MTKHDFFDLFNEIDFYFSAPFKRTNQVAVIPSVDCLCFDQHGDTFLVKQRSVRLCHIGRNQKGFVLRNKWTSNMFEIKAPLCFRCQDVHERVREINRRKVSEGMCCPLLTFLFFCLRRCSSSHPLSQCTSVLSQAFPLSTEMNKYNK